MDVEVTRIQCEIAHVVDIVYLYEVHGHSLYDHRLTKSHMVYHRAFS